MPEMIFARENGQWLDFPGLKMAGRSGDTYVYPTKKELIPLPEGATLVMMPSCAPVGFDEEKGEFLLLDENPYNKKPEKICAMAALLPQGFSRSYLPAAQDGTTQLPLLGYTAVGIEKGRLMVAAAATDEHRRWHPRHYNSESLPKLVEDRKREFNGNSIIEQLAYCALEYGCFTAQNIFYRRWEGGIPVSPVCNADCIGCISKQASECCPAPQSRIVKAPEADEVIEVTVAHLKKAEGAIISFGQGCEGEPSLQADLICQAIAGVREKTPRGIININSNAGDTKAIAKLCAGGLNSMRVSLFSPFAEEYAAYHRPHGYGLDDVLRSLSVAAQYGVPVDLNLLAYPGFTDEPARLQAICDICRDYKIRRVQIRNLNIDPKVMGRFISGRGLSLNTMLSEFAAAGIEVGNYTHEA